MSIKIGINDGVVRDIKQPYTGRSGAVYSVWNGYVGVDGVARRFMADGISSVINILETQQFTLRIYSISGTESTSYEYSNILNVTDTIDNLSKADYSSYGINIFYDVNSETTEDGTTYKSLKSITVRSSMIGYAADIDGAVSAYIGDHKYSISTITAKATVKTKVGYSLSFSCRKGGYVLDAFGQTIKDGYVSGSASGTVDVTISNSSFTVSSEVRPDSNSGVATATMLFNDITIDDKVFKLKLGG